MNKLCILGYLILANIAFSQIPQTISYQGVLTDASGMAVTDGNYSLTFNLYESATGGSSIWGETQDIAVVNGLFNAILGSVKPLSNSFDRPYWLGIAIGSDAELEPRIELTSSAYSLNARSVADSSVTSAKIADGQVVRVLQISPINGFTASLTDTVRLKAGANITFDAGVGPNGGLIIFISATSSNSGGDGHSLDASDGNPANALFVDAEGRVGIGTTTPSARLHVVNTGTGHGIRLESDLTGIIVDKAGVDGLFITTAGRHGVQVIKAGNPSAFNNNTESNAFMVQGAEGFGLFVGHADQDGVHVESAGGDGIEVASANGFGIRAKGSQGAAFLDGKVEITGNLELPASTANTGLIKVAGKRFIHSFGFRNFFAGENAGNLTMTGGANTASGVDAFSSNTTGNNNTAFGESALFSNTSGNVNMASGRGALFSNTTGSFNMASGRNALINNTTGSNNTASGRRALNSNTTGSNNTAIGSNANVNDGNFNNATAVGANSVVNASNKIRLGDDNVTVVETNAMFHSLSGGFKFPDGSVQTTASASNPSPWQTAGSNIVYEKGNIAIGTNDASNIVTVVKNSNTDPIADAWTTYSSRRWKTNIEAIENPLEKVQALRGVTYDWKESGKHDIGLIAEEVGEVIPEIVAYEKNGVDAKSVDYSRLVAVLIEAVKELSGKVQRLESANAQMLASKK